MTEAIALCKAAKRLGYQVRTLSGKAKRGEIPGAFRLGDRGHWRIPVEALERIAQNGPATGR